LILVSLPQWNKIFLPAVHFYSMHDGPKKVQRLLFEANFPGENCPLQRNFVYLISC